MMSFREPLFSHLPSTQGAESEVANSISVQAWDRLSENHGMVQSTKEKWQDDPICVTSMVNPKYCHKRSTPMSGPPLFPQKAFTLDFPTQRGQMGRGDRL